MIYYITTISCIAVIYHYKLYRSEYYKKEILQSKLYLNLISEIRKMISYLRLKYNY